MRFYAVSAVYDTVSEYKEIKPSCPLHVIQHCLYNITKSSLKEVFSTPLPNEEAIYLQLKRTQLNLVKNIKKLIVQKYTFYNIVQLFICC